MCEKREELLTMRGTVFCTFLSNGLNTWEGHRRGYYKILDGNEQKH